MEVRDLEIKEMPLEEKYERLLNQMIMVWAAGYAWHKKNGTIDEWTDFLAKAQEKTLPLSTGLGKAFFESAKTVTPGRTFKQVVNEAVYDQQKWLPLSCLEVSYISDREAIFKVKNCPFIKAYSELSKKTGLDITPKYVCENDLKFMPKVFKEFGVDLTSKIEENGCQITVKLK
jgi:hypothetical protein